MAAKDIKVDARERLTEEFNVWKTNHPKVRESNKAGTSKLDIFSSIVLYFTPGYISAIDLISKKLLDLQSFVQLIIFIAKRLVLGRIYSAKQCLDSVFDRYYGYY